MDTSALQINETLGSGKIQFQNHSLLPNMKHQEEDFSSSMEPTSNLESHCHPLRLWMIRNPYWKSSVVIVAIKKIAKALHVAKYPLHCEGVDWKLATQNKNPKQTQTNNQPPSKQFPIQLDKTKANKPSETSESSHALLSNRQFQTSTTSSKPCIGNAASLDLQHQASQYDLPMHSLQVNWQEPWKSLCMKR